MRQSVEKELVCIFQAARNILLQMFRTSMTRHRQQSAEVTARGIDPMCSEVYSSLPQSYHTVCHPEVADSVEVWNGSLKTQL